MSLNPRKKFKFRVKFLDAPSIPYLYFQSVTLPSQEIEQDEHGEGNTIIKTGGLVKTGNATFERLLPGSGDNNAVSGEIWAWLSLVQSQRTGGGSDPKLYKKVAEIDELDHAGEALDTWTLVGCFPININGREFNAAESGNRIETFELSVDRMFLNATVM